MSSRRRTLIARALGLSIEEPVEIYHTSEHLFTDLSIPEGVTGRLPKDKQTLAGLDAEEIEDLGETGRRERGREDRAGRRRSGSRRAGSGRGRGRSSSTSSESNPVTKTQRGERRKRKRKRTRGGKEVPRRDRQD